MKQILHRVTFEGDSESRGITLRPAFILVPKPARGVQTKSGIRYISTHRLAGALLVCLAVQSMISVSIAWTNPPQVSLLDWSYWGIASSSDSGTVDDRPARTFARREILASIVAAGLFFPFLIRANLNARALGAVDLSPSPAWTVGCFLVPIVNLWKPHQVLQELWKASSSSSGSWNQVRSSLLITVWWLVRLADGGLSQSVWLWRRWHPAETTLWGTNIDASQLATTVQLLHVVQYGLTILLVCAFQRRQQERYAQFGAKQAYEFTLNGPSLIETPRPFFSRFDP
jgi:hypothetical protein